MEFLYEKDEIESLDLKNTIFIFDTNVWLDLYRFPKKCSDEILHGLSWNIDNLWIPNQVFKEFKDNYKKNRGRNATKINLQSDLDEMLKKLEDQVNNKFKIYSQREVIEVPKIDEFKNELLKGIHVLRTEKLLELNRIFEEIKNINTYTEKDDAIETFVNALKENSKSQEFKVLELLKIYEEGELRYKYNIPPGFTDKEKPNSKYGDLVLWKEIIQKSQQEQCNIVLVQNEQKIDWWTIEGDKKKIPQVLVEEFNESTNGQENKFLMMDFTEFLNHFSGFFHIPATTIVEIASKLEVLEDMKKELLEKRISIFRESMNLENNFIPYITEELSKSGYLDKKVDKVKDINLYERRAIECVFVKELFSRQLLFEGKAKANGSVLVHKNNTIYHTLLVEISFDYLMEVFILNLSKEIEFTDYYESIHIKSIEIDYFEIENELKEEEVDFRWMAY